MRKNPEIQNLINNGVSTLIESMDLLAVGIRKNGQIFYANPYFLKITGYKMSQLLNKDWYETLLPEKTRENVRKAFERLYIDTFHKDYINSILTAHRTEIEVNWNNSVIMDAHSTMLGLFSIGVELVPRNKIFALLKESKDEFAVYTKQLEEKNKFLEDSEKAMLNLLEDSKELEEELKEEKRHVDRTISERTLELREEQARLLAAINSVPNGFIVTNINKEVLLVNDALAHIINPQIHNWDLHKIQNEIGHTVDILKSFDVCTAKKEPITLTDIDLKNKIIRIYMAPIFINQLSNDIIGIIILIDDITEARITERSKDEFFSIASHELRTPLTAIRGNTELLTKYFSQKSGMHDTQDIINDMHGASIRLIELVNDFLTTSKLEQGKMDFATEQFDIGKLIADVVKELKMQALTKNIYIATEIEDKPTPMVTADRNRTREVLLNLVSNAIKFTEKGGITIRTESRDKFTYVSVKDTGKGIPLKNQNLLFRKFQQTNANILVRDAAEGTGLGLYISKLLVEAMGGKIYLESSTQDKGTTFTFKLPV